MSPERYRNALSEFDGLLAHGRAVSEQLTGRNIARKEFSYADAIYTKLLCHAISLRKLSPSFSQDSELWDVASAAAVARSLIEAFDALAYIGIHSITEGEREFRILLWELHDQQRRLRILEKVRSSNPQVGEIQKRADALLTSVVTHPSTHLLPQKLRGKSMVETRRRSI